MSPLTTDLLKAENWEEKRRSGGAGTARKSSFYRMIRLKTSTDMRRQMRANHAWNARRDRGIVTNLSLFNATDEASCAEIFGYRVPAKDRTAGKALHALGESAEQFADSTTGTNL